MKEERRKKRKWEREPGKKEEKSWLRGKHTGNTVQEILQ